ncbi:MAG: tRNA pseudouridine(54/55) synthase Pus10 [Candidatus Diapherotrites archaeon]|nr:tRNA pseudouridine(54/55) synthase Pus10 [Candidatus Diapherotrites archaeon]MDZ4256336.1 tRNA pseudouridine(54/55) synthase Pus10 [archaeon]
MVTPFQFPFTGTLPHFHSPGLEVDLAKREFRTYALGVRSPDPEAKQRALELLRKEVETHSLFRGKELVHQQPDIELVFDLAKKIIDLHVFPLILTGKYTKLVRTIAQTFHYCPACKGIGCASCGGKGKITEESVQELLSPFLKDAFACDAVLFHGAGREDVDVRMLGSGRPFAITLENPRKRAADMARIQENINISLTGKVQVSHLEIGIPFDVARLTQQYHTKRYRALVKSSIPLEISKLQTHLGQKIDVLQTTPIRVEKRRVMKQRPHWVILEKVEHVDDTHILIHLHASAGCYIKEFISGDEGRSVPSFADWVGVPCVCEELDVLEIVEGQEKTFYVVE